MGFIYGDNHEGFPCSSFTGRNQCLERAFDAETDHAAHHANHATHNNADTSRDATTLSGQAYSNTKPGPVVQLQQPELHTRVPKQHPVVGDLVQCHQRPAG